MMIKIRSRSIIKSSQAEARNNETTTDVKIQNGVQIQNGAKFKSEISRVYIRIKEKFKHCYDFISQILPLVYTMKY